MQIGNMLLSFASARLGPGDCGKGVAAWLLLVAAFSSFVGCGSGGYIPVTGRVVDREGQPITGLEGAQIEFESVEKPISSVGEIQADGRFELITANPGDGAVAGKHRVLIARKYFDPERAAPRVIAERYESFETSGLEADISPENHHFEFKLDLYGAPTGP